MYICKAASFHSFKPCCEHGTTSLSFYSQCFSWIQQSESSLKIITLLLFHNQKFFSCLHEQILQNWNGCSSYSKLRQYFQRPLESDFPDNLVQNLILSIQISWGHNSIFLQVLMHLDYFRQIHVLPSCTCGPFQASLKAVWRFMPKSVS